MKCRYACGTSDHLIARRSFLGGAAAGLGVAGGLNPLSQQAVAKGLAASRRQMLIVYLSGGSSQLETWDPKPGTDTGGPFLPINTSMPGTHICELLPYTAQQMHRLALVRSVNTRENNHAKGKYLMTRGRRQSPATDYPHLGAIGAKALAPEDSPLPGYIRITPRGGGGRSSDSAYLGPKYSSMVLGGGNPPQNSERHDSLTTEAAQRRSTLRQRINDQFASRRRTAATEAYTYSYEQAARLIQRRHVFDVSKEPKKDQDRYGSHDFGRHCLLARRLLEHGVTFVQVAHTNYDTHFENFDFHIEQLGEFDRPFATLIDDLAERGLLDSTLVVVMSEFGRTPKINSRYGRDHWGTAWSVALGGAGIQPGAVIGKTNKNGTAVVEREVDHSHLFHTYLQAVGVDSTDVFQVGGRPMLIADPQGEAIQELLA